MNDSRMGINNNFVAASPELTLIAKKNKIHPSRSPRLLFEDINDRDDIEDAIVLDNTNTIPVVTRESRGGGIKIGNLTNFS